MTDIQEFRKTLFFEEGTSDHEQSIILVEAMNAIGFSKSEREIHRNHVHINNELLNIFKTTDKTTLTGSTSDGMCGGIYGNACRHDHDVLMTARDIKLYTPRTHNPTPLQLHDSEDYDASFFVEEDDNFPGYVKLSLAEVKNNSVYLNHCTIMNNNRLYLLNYMIVDSIYEPLVKLSKEFDRITAPCLNIHLKNGPAHTIHKKSLDGNTRKSDTVLCIHHDMWPNSANSFITRRKPINWPSNSMLENIQSQGCDVVPVGHHDSQNKDIQWRISFPGEHNLLLGLTDVQTLCYALIKLILRESLNTYQREVVSSFHIKHVMFWCVDLCSCQWVHSNFINCLNICLAKLIEMIKARHIPHYIIECRNLFNSKMTETISKEIVEVLSKYDTKHVFMLPAFEHVFKLTDNRALLKCSALKSTIMACFIGSFCILSCYVCCPRYFWALYISHNATKSLLKYLNILQNLKKLKGVSIQYTKCLVRSMLGFLYYAKYKESNKADVFLKSKRLIHKSLNLDNSCVKLRAATFFLANLEYSQSIDISDTFITSPPRYTRCSLNCEYNTDISKEVLQEVCKLKTTAEMETILKEILPMFYGSVKLKSLPKNYDITQENPVSIFRNFTNLFCRGLYSNVTFMTAEKWVVPDPILYELLSLPQDADYEVIPISGVHLDPVFVCFQTKFVCYHSMGNAAGMAEMLTLMNSVITEDTFTTQPSYVYLNMFAYCQIKAGHHRQSVKSILQSVRNFPSRYNAASGYLKIVLQILNSLSI